MTALARLAKRFHRHVTESGIRAVDRPDAALGKLLRFLRGKWSRDESAAYAAGWEHALWRLDELGESAVPLFEGEARDMFPGDPMDDALAECCYEGMLVALSFYRMSKNIVTVEVRALGHPPITATCEADEAGDTLWELLIGVGVPESAARDAIVSGGYPGIDWSVLTGVTPP